MRRTLSSLEHAKDQLSIFDAWNALGLPGHPRPSCRSPFRQDREPSFSNDPKGRVWFDHGLNKGGDVVSFVAEAKRLAQL